MTLAEVYGLSNQPAAGLEVLREAIAQAEDNRGDFVWAELHRLTGELLLQRSSDNALNRAAQH